MAIDTGFFKLNITPIAGCEARVCFYRSPDVVMWPSDGKWPVWSSLIVKSWHSCGGFSGTANRWLDSLWTMRIARRIVHLFLARVGHLQGTHHADNDGNGKNGSLTLKQGVVVGKSSFADFWSAPTVNMLLWNDLARLVSVTKLAIFVIACCACCCLCCGWRWPWMLFCGSGSSLQRKLFLLLAAAIRIAMSIRTGQQQ